MRCRFHQEKALCKIDFATLKCRQIPLSNNGCKIQWIFAILAIKKFAWYMLTESPLLRSTEAENTQDLRRFRVEHSYSLGYYRVTREIFSLSIINEPTPCSCKNLGAIVVYRPISVFNKSREQR